MKASDYIEAATKTESLPSLILTQRQTRLLHAAMGLETESGEIVDMLKRHLFYGYNMDRINALEEVGDILWYIALILDELDSSFEMVMAANIAKLQFRYPEQFDATMAIIRDKANEREVLRAILE